MKKKSSYLAIIIFLISSFSYTICFGAETITFKSDKEIVEKNEEFNIAITISNPEIVAFTMEIYYDTDKLDYISNFENINFSNDRLIYVWFDKDGGKERRKDVITQNLSFKAKEFGEVNFIIRGEFYGIDGKQINIGDIFSDVIITDTQTQNITSDNAYLKKMSLDYEGITPDFDKNIFEYYINVPVTLKQVKINAIPENNKAQVNISGNTFLQNGLNTFVIEVISEDKSNKQEYKIFVTKTSNLESANTNLETLSIENTSLFPSFSNQITDYQVEVENSIKKVNLLAIAESPKAIVNIEGNQELKIGKNPVKITVLAENGVTKKIYTVDIYRRNLEEDIEKIEDIEKNKELLNKLIKEKNINTISNENIVIEETNNEENEIIIENEKKEQIDLNSKKESKKNIWFLFLIFIGICIVILVTIFRKKRKK